MPNRQSSVTNTQENKHPSDPIVRKKYPWLKYILNFLFWCGASASALQGFFSIQSFISSLGAIPGMAFLLLIPYVFIFVSAIIIALYSIIVEQQIFREYFERLLAQLFGVEYEDIASKKINPSKKAEDNRTYNERTHELKEKIRELDHHPKAEDDIANKDKQNQYNLFWFLHLCHTIFAYTAAGFIVGLRALVSIGSTMLGIQILIGLILSPLGLTAPLGIIPLCAIMSAVGYFIKTSQNIVDQFNETLKILGLKRFVKTDYKEIKKDYEQKLKTIYESEITKTNEIKIEEPKLSFWKSCICLIMEIGFVFGAVGASMQGFFSIQKFVSQMGIVPFLSFFNIIPPIFIISCAAVIAMYTLFVEQKILYQYFHGLIIDWLQPNNNQDLYYVEYENKPDLNDYKLKILEKDVDYIIKEIKATDNSIKYKIIFNSKDAYKTYCYNQKIDSIYNHQILKTAGQTRAETKINDQLPKPVKKITHNFLWFNFARIGTVFILLLRAITSIGPSVLGLATVINLVTGMLSITLGPWVFLPCIIMATFGYMIKCSQNIYNHYHNTMRDMFGIQYEQSYQDKAKLSTKLNDEYIEVLELFNKTKTTKKSTCPSDDSDNTTSNPPPPPGGDSVSVKIVVSSLRSIPNNSNTDYSSDADNSNYTSFTP
jgi:hypothetical protein